MADQTYNKLLQIISDSESDDLRLAALKVVGAVGKASERNLIKTLTEVLKNTQEDLRISAIETLGQLHAEEALGPITAFVRQGGPELEAAVHAASQMGARGARQMGKVMHEVSPALRSRMAAVLAKSNTGNALIVTAQGLLDEDSKVIDATARSLAMEIPTYSTPQRNALAKFLIESLGEKKIPPRSEAAQLRVLAALHETKADDLFWSRILPPHAHDVRSAALQALGSNAMPTTEKRLQALLICAGEKDFQIVAAALMILKKVPVSSKNSRHWIKLLDAPDVATRRFAVEKLQGFENLEVARAMVAQLGHPDRALRESTLKALQGYTAGQTVLLEELLRTEEFERAWFLAKALVPVSKELNAAQRTKTFALAAKYHDADDRRAVPILFLLREMDHAWMRDQLLSKAQELRKKKKYAQAISYYRLLTQDPACGEEIRFELAATGLKETSKDLTIDNRTNDPSLHQFTRLLQNASFDLIDHVNKAKWLDAEDLFYLGFHFAEQVHRARDFGKHVLEMVIKRSPKSEHGKQAKRKLKSEGLV